LVRKTSQKTLKERIQFVIDKTSLVELIKNRNRYDEELSLKINLHLFNEDWMLVDKKVEDLVGELQNSRKLLKEAIIEMQLGDCQECGSCNFYSEVQFALESIDKVLDRLRGD